MIDLTSFSNAIKQLETGILTWQMNPEIDLLRDGVIQRFEFTYELAAKTLRRYLAGTEPDGQKVVELSFPNLIRLASQRGLLLNGWDVWTTYRDGRNMTSHAYNEDKARLVVNIIPGFLEDTTYLRDSIATRQNA